MLTKTYTTKVQKCLITLGEPEITEAIMEWLVKHGHHKKIEKDPNSSQVGTELELFDDNHAEITLIYHVDVGPAAGNGLVEKAKSLLALTVSLLGDGMTRGTEPIEVKELREAIEAVKT